MRMRKSSSLIVGAAVSVGTLLLLVLSVDGLDLFTDKVHVVLQLLYLTVHLVNKRVAFLGTGIEESQVILVGLNLLLDSLILTEETGALVVKGILSTLSHLLQVLLEVVKTTLGNADIQFLVELIKNCVVLFIELVFLAERYMADRLILFYQLLNCLLDIVASLFSSSFQFLNDTLRSLTPAMCWRAPATGRRQISRR